MAGNFKKRYNEKFKQYRILNFWVFLIVNMPFLGCCHPVKEPGPIPDPITRQQAIDAYNRNALAVTNFRARLNEWEIQFFEDEQTRHHFNEKGGRLFYQAPDPTNKYPQIHLNASGGPLGQEALVVASNQEGFWMYSRPAKWNYRDTHANAAGIGGENLFIMNPQLILEFIGLSPIPVESLVGPYPIYKIAPEQNIIEYAFPGETGLREIIIDRRSNLPQQINFYDPSGLRILASQLGNYQALGDARLPGEILLSAPQEDSFFRLQLTNYQMRETMSPRLFIPPDDFDSIPDKH